ncbi:MAG TPA: 1,4-alpha-glucan branching protein GlgB [Gammaproteobacteria bacterium]|nr:1,4-alpha-glucan branching protein GlgB [Gammaproteobacteria bacterium]
MRSSSGNAERTDVRHPDVERLLAGRLHDPRLVLGVHAASATDALVRVLLPNAKRVQLVSPEAELERVPGTALFEWTGPRRLLATPYRVRWQGFDDAWHEHYDPYSFPPQIDAFDLARFAHGNHVHAHRFLGAHELTLEGVRGIRFAVWAPNAERVSVVGTFNHWDGRYHPMSVRGDSGIWELFLPELRTGELYKYEVLGRESRELFLKTDPFGALFENRPATAAVAAPKSEFKWTDSEWLKRRAQRDWLREPISIYEVHLGSWRRGPAGRFLSYREIAEQLGNYVADLGFTHVELLPVTEHPLDESWGYQCTGYFAPTRRHGLPDELRELVSGLHERGIGVLLDWVPGHFPKDAHALARFDGTPLYEYGDKQKGEHPDWDTLVFNYSRNEVQSFLLSSAVCWLDDFHFDGLRVDAVASMLYLDYSRRPHQWTPNQFGGNENLEAIAFLKRLNEVTHGECPGTLTIAEESTAWPQVSRPTYGGGLGFTFKWNMGWMHDTLSYMTKDPIHRQFHHNLLTFGPIYVFTENFVSPLSHDEVVHGKRSLLDKMPGDDWQRFANLRLLLTFQWTYPGKKLLFMGAEFGQPREWNHAESLPWHIADEPRHAGVRALVRDLNRVYRETPALHRRDHDGNGFAWLTWQDQQNSVLSFVRKDGDAHAVVLLNFTPIPRHGYRVGVPARGRYREALNSDSSYYGGSNVGTPAASTEDVPCMGYAQSIVVTVPPLAGLVLLPE